MKRISLTLAASLALFAFAMTAQAEDLDPAAAPAMPPKTQGTRPSSEAAKQAKEQRQAMLENEREYAKTAAEKKREDLKNVREQTRENVKDIEERKREDIKNMREGIQENAKQMREGMREDIKEMRSFASSTPEMKKKIIQMRASTTDAIKMMRQDGLKEIKERREASRDDIRKALEERKMKMASTTDAAKEARAARQLEEAGKLADRMVENLTNAITRVSNLSSRIQSRMIKVKAAGGDTAAAQSALDGANANILAAKSALPQVTTAFANAAKLANPKDGASAIQAARDAVTKEIVGAQNGLKAAAAALEGQKGIDAAPTTVLDESASAGASTNTQAI